MTQVKPFPLRQGPMPFSAHGTRRDRLSSQTRPNLGAGTTASGSRDRADALLFSFIISDIP